jgi:osmotically-inducible protein OsmY
MKTDSEVQNAVIEELRWIPFFNSSEIGVAVKNGIVTLTGTVDTYSKKSAAEIAAKKVSGVKAVAEEITVNLPGTSHKTDSDLAAAVLNAIKWHSAFIEDTMKVVVDAGVVTLDGEVDWEFQRNSAQLMIEDLMGVRSIINNLKIKPKIIAAFHRSATINAENIEVEISGNKAILKGNVYSTLEKDDAAKAVWAVSGIQDVDNRIAVNTEVLMF